MLALPDGAGRADDAAAFGGEEPGDVGSDAPARAGDQHYLAVESAHGRLRAAIVHDGAARSTGRSRDRAGTRAYEVAGMATRSRSPGKMRSGRSRAFHFTSSLTDTP